MTTPKTFSYTRRTRLKRCPHAYHLYHNVGLKPKYKSDGLVDGSAFSDALEAWNADAVDDVFGEVLASANHPEHIERLVIRREIVRHMAATYIQRYPKPAAREIEFKIPISDTGVLDHGYIDGLEERNGAWWLVEDKLKKSWWGSMKDALPMDNQVTSYLYAAGKLAEMPLQASVEHSESLPGFPRVVGCLYRVSVKPMLKPNTRTGETRNAFIERLRGVIEADPICTCAHDQRGCKARYFHEYELTRTADDFYRHEREVAYLVREEAQRQVDGRTDPDGAWRRHEESCHAYGGCEYLPICTGADAGMDKFTTRRGENQ